MSQMLEPQDTCVLVTGGAGFIGSHTVVELLNCNYQVVIVDDIMTSGATARSFAEELSAAGATIIGGLFLCRTITKEGTYYESK